MTQRGATTSAAEDGTAPTLRRPALRRRLGGALRATERAWGGGRTRERVLLCALRSHYASRFRREWYWSAEPPHFFDHRLGAFELAFGDARSGPYPWSRAFSAAEVIHDGDTLLDIGCGDGFFTARFFAARCSAVDGVDVDLSAIAAANANNRANGVRYHLCDAVTSPFPSDRYDVVVWDGALGHFTAGDGDKVLTKIHGVLDRDGIFCGSESLGREGTDHLTFFDSLDAVAAVLIPHFPCLWLKEVEYEVGGLRRREAFWRAAFSPARQEGAAWQAIRGE